MVELYSREGFSLYVSDCDYYNYKHDERVEVTDNFGYKYWMEKFSVANMRKRRTIPARFFLNNPYTEHNIRVYLEEISGGNVILKDFNNAKNAHSKLILYNKKQDLTYEKSWNDIKRGNYYYKTLDPDYKRPKATRGNYISPKKLSQKEVEEYLDSRGLIMIGEYINNATPIQFICKKHKDEGTQKMSWVTMKKSQNPCKYCKLENNTQRLTNEEYMGSIENLKSSNIEVIGKYEGAHKKIECKCKKCGRTIFLRADHIRRGIGCGQCTKSIGEDRVEQFLLRYNIYYEREYRFRDCVRVERSLPFDFYLPDLDTVIEFDGVQHFQVVGKFGEKSHNELKLNDEYKNKYCKEHNIKIIRISYKDIDKVDEILSKKFHFEN